MEITSLHLQHAIDNFYERSFRLQAYKAIGRLVAAFEEKKSRNAGNAVFRGYVRAVVGVQLANLDLTGIIDRPISRLSALMPGTVRTRGPRNRPAPACRSWPLLLPNWCHSARRHCDPAIANPFE